MAKEGNLFYFRNPGGLAIRKHLSDILKERYPKYDDFLERLGNSIQTEKDLQVFASLVVEIYELGYLKAMRDYQGELSKLGYNAKIIPSATEQTNSKIFK